jgi:hypothetical protein
MISIMRVSGSTHKADSCCVSSTGLPQWCNFCGFFLPIALPHSFELIDRYIKMANDEWQMVSIFHSHTQFGISTP